MNKSLTINFFAAVFFSAALVLLSPIQVFSAEEASPIATPPPLIEPTMYPEAHEIMSCMVPAESVKVFLQIEMYNDTSKDFLSFTLDEDGTTSVFHNQDDKDKIKENIEAGSLNMLLLTDRMSQENGVIKNVGLLSLSKQDDAFSGFLVAKGNIYPLICVSLLPKKVPAKPVETPVEVPQKNDPIKS